jgi:hypothetical protein
VSGAGTAAKPKYMFCWECSRRLHANFHRVCVVQGNRVIVHAECAEREGYEIIEGAHLKANAGEGR